MTKQQLKILLLKVQTETLLLVIDKNFSEDAFQEVIEQTLNKVDFDGEFPKYMSERTQTED